MIRIENLCFAFGTTPVLRDINLEVQQGEILSILGPNGCGKSTLLRLLRGQLTADSGNIRWQERDIATLSRREIARLAAVVPQATQTPFPYPVREMVAMGRFASQSALAGLTNADRRAVEQALILTDIAQLAERPATALSGGELQRVLLARALAQETPVLLLDEATSHLDFDHRLEITDLLARLNREQGTTVIQVSHDLDLAAAFSHRILLLSRQGKVAALGTPQQVYTPENFRQVFRVEVSIETAPRTGAPRVFPLGRCAS